MSLRLNNCKLIFVNREMLLYFICSLDALSVLSVSIDEHLLNHSAVRSNILHSITIHFSLSSINRSFKLKACSSMKCLYRFTFVSLHLVPIEMHFYPCSSASVSIWYRVITNNRSLRRIHLLLK